MMDARETYFHILESILIKNGKLLCYNQIR